MDFLDDIPLLKNIPEEERFGWMVTGILHLVLIIFFLLYTFSINDRMRTTFIEVEFGEYQSGTRAQFSEVTNEEVATRPDPSEQQPEEPQPEPQEEVQEEQATTEEEVKQVDAPDQENVQDEQKVTTPDTEKIDPTKETAQEEQQEAVVPPKVEEDSTRQEGAEISGDVDGTEGDVNADQGTGNEQERSSPYELEWEGDIERAPMIQPLPENNADVEATITVRFEVKPDGTIGRMVPIRKMNPELEREVLSTLRSWRFSRLPSGVPQQSQWGTITFRFVLE